MSGETGRVSEVDYKWQGKRNRSRGDAFEKLVVNYFNQLNPTAMAQQVDRNQKIHSSLPDIIFGNNSSFAVDCKYTEQRFTLGEKEELIEAAHSKYGRQYFCVCVVFGEKYGGKNIRVDQCLMGFKTLTPQHGYYYRSLRDFICSLC